MDWNFFRINEAHKYLKEDAPLNLEVEFMNHNMQTKETMDLAGEDAVVDSVL